METVTEGSVLPHTRRSGRARWIKLALGATALGAIVALAGPGDSPGTADDASTLPISSTSPGGSGGRVEADADPIAAAKRAIAACRDRYREVEDYTCTFLKRERIDGRLLPHHIMAMKVRTRPFSLYLKFRTPTPGREAIYIEGRNAGKVLAHDVGLVKLLGGTMELDPRGSFAMEDCRHPVTEAGIGHMIETVAERWDAELTPGETVVQIDPDAQLGDRSCTRICSVHTKHRPDFLFHKVLLYIDRESGLPIRFEAFNWPRTPGEEPELVEEYTYTDLKINTGLSGADFDVANGQYAFGRF